MQKNVLSVSQANRDKKYQILTQVYSEKGKLYVSKRVLNPSARAHLENMKITYSVLKESGFNVAAILNSSTNRLIFPYLKTGTVDSHLYSAILSGNIDLAINYIEKVFDIIDALSKKVPSMTLIDCNFDNFILSSGDLTIIDYEWVTKDRNIDIKIIKTRALYYFFRRYVDTFSYLPTQSNKYYASSNGQLFIPQKIYRKLQAYLSPSMFEQLATFEDKFLKQVYNVSVQNKFEYNFKLTISSNNSLLHHYELLVERAVSHESQMKILSQQNEEMSRRLHNIESSRSWKIIQKLRVLLRR